MIQKKSKRNSLFFLMVLLLMGMNAFGQAKKKNNYQEFSSLFSRGATFEQQNSLDSAVSVYRIILLKLKEYSTQDSNNLRLNQLTISAMSRLGAVHYRRADYHVAIPMLQKALKLAQEDLNNERIAEILHRLASCYTMIGEHEQALDLYNKAILFQRHLNKDESVAKTLNNIGYLFYMQKDYNRSLEYYYESLSLKSLYKDKSSYASTLNNIGSAYLHLKKPDSALIYLEKARTLSFQINEPISIFRTYISFGEYYLETGRFSQAINQLHKALKLSENIGDNYEITLLYFLTAQTYQKMGKINESNEFAKKTHLLAIRYDIAEIKTEILKLMAGNFTFEKRFDLALRLSKEYAAVRDSFIDHNKQARLIELDMVYQAEVKDKKITLNKAQIALQSEEAKRRENLKIFYFAIVLVLLLILAFSIYSYRLKVSTGVKLMQKQQFIVEQKSEIEQQLKQLELNSFETSARMEEIEAQKESFLEQKNEIEKYTATLARLSNELVDSLLYAQTIQKSVFEHFSKKMHALIDDFLISESNGIVSTSFVHKIVRSDRIIYLIFESLRSSTPGAMICLILYSKLAHWLENVKVWRTETIFNTIHENLEAEKAADPGHETMFAFSVVAYCIQSGTVEYQGDHAVWLVDKDHSVSKFTNANEYHQTPVKRTEWCYIFSQTCDLSRMKISELLAKMSNKSIAEQESFCFDCFKQDELIVSQRDAFAIGIHPAVRNVFS